MIMQDTIYVTYIATSAEKLWEALTGAEFTRQYFFGRSIESDWKVGSDIVYRMPDGRVDVQGNILACDPPRLLKFTWHVVWLGPSQPQPGTIVSYTIEPAGETVRLTMLEEHPDGIEEKFLEGGRHGWPIILSGLKSLMEIVGSPGTELEFAL